MSVKINPATVSLTPDDIRVAIKDWLRANHNLRIYGGDFELGSVWKGDQGETVPVLKGFTATIAKEAKP